MTTMPSNALIRCPWAAGRGSKESQKRMQDYHDREWGVPMHDEKRHFEFLLLESFQAGLSWQTILDRREAFRVSFADFEAKRVAGFDSRKIDQLLQDKNIIRNRSKIEGAIHNANCFLQIQREWGGFDAYIWHFSEGKSLHNQWYKPEQIPKSSPFSQVIAHDMKRRGFCRLGAITVYAHLQAIGVVNDHLTNCFRYHQLCHKST